jgi:hypothetical protein
MGFNTLVFYRSNLLNNINLLSFTSLQIFNRWMSDLRFANVMGSVVEVVVDSRDGAATSHSVLVAPGQPLFTEHSILDQTLQGGGFYGALGFCSAHSHNHSKKQVPKTEDTKKKSLGFLNTSIIQQFNARLTFLASWAADQL